MILIYVALALYVSGGVVALLLSKMRCERSMPPRSEQRSGFIARSKCCSTPIKSCSRSGREVLFQGSLLVGIDPLSAFFLAPARADT